MAVTPRSIGSRRAGESKAMPAHAERQWLVVALAAFLALNGLAIVYGGIIAARSAAQKQGFDTSFGSMHVTGTEVIGGLTPGDVSGMTHGLAGYVSAEQAEVVVELHVANTSDHRVRLEPDQFSLTVAGLDPVRPAGGTMSPVALQAGASLEARLSFVVPRTTKEGTLTFADAADGTKTLAIGPFDAGAPSFEPGAPHAH